MQEVYECPRCHRECPSTEFYWSRGRRSTYCRKCQNKYTSTSRQRAQARKRNYGLTPEGFAHRMRMQGGVCAICKRPPEAPPRGGNPVFHVDHNHVTGEVRGLLCSNCNMALGLFGDDISRLQRAITYLSGYTIEAPLQQLDPDNGERELHIEAAYTDELTLANEQPRAMSALYYLNQLNAGYDTPRALCMRADNMPFDEEDKARPSSEFQKRRREQCYVLQAIFQHLFEKPLSNGQAKTLLQNAGDITEEVLDLMEDLRRLVDGGKKIDAPASYLIGMVKGQRRDATRTPGGIPSGSPQIKRAVIDKPEPEQPQANFYMDKPSDRQAKVMARLQAAGYLEDDDDDDD